MQDGKEVLLKSRQKFIENMPVSAGFTFCKYSADFYPLLKYRLLYHVFGIKSTEGKLFPIVENENYDDIIYTKMKFEYEVQI